jgi:hypothetical protein
MFRKISDGLAPILVFIAISSILTVCRAPSDGHETVQTAGDQAQGREMSQQEKSSTVKVLVPDEDGEPSVWVSPVEGLCTIEGEVRDEKGRPIRNAKIHISMKERDYSTWISVDDQGRFQVENLNHGSYEFQMELSKGHIHETRFMHWEVVPGINCIFFQPEKNGARLFGKVLDPEGNPVSDCHVYANYPTFHQSQTGAGFMSTSTNGEGRYSFSNIPPGTYELKIVKAELWHGCPGGMVALADNEMRNFTVKIQPGWVKGKIKVHGGVPPQDYIASVWAKKKDTPKAASWTGSKIATDGSFEIRGLPPGHYITRFYSEDYLAEKKVTFTIPGRRGPVEIEIPVIPAGTALVKVIDGNGNPRKEEARIARVIPGKPTKGVNVNVEKLTLGEYRIKALKPEPHRFIVDVQGIGMIRRDVEIKAGEEALIEIQIDPPPIDFGITVETQAVPSKDPFVFYPLRPFLKKNLRAAIARKDRKAEPRWLKMWEDFGYNEEKTVLWFLKDIPIDREREFILLKGIPYPRNIFFFNKQLDPGTVEMILNGRKLIEGEGFIVNYKLGKITVLDPDIEEAGAEFTIRSEEDEIT